MTDLVKKEYECNDCGSIYKLQYDQNEVQLDYAADYPNVCPFCSGEVLDEEGDDFGLDMTDRISFGKGVDHMDSDDPNIAGIDDYD